MRSSRSLYKSLTLSGLLKIILIRTIVSGSHDLGYLGCFVDDETVRDLGGHSEELPSTNTREACQDVCKRRGFLYAGVQQGTQCRCGDVYGQYGQVGDSECNVACSGDGAQMCGAEKRNGVHKSGLKLPIWEEIVLTPNSVEPKIVDFDVGSTDGVHAIWGLSENNKFLIAENGNWEIVPGGGYTLTVGNTGVFHGGVATIYKRNGISPERHEGSGWADMNGHVDLMDSGPVYLYGIHSEKLFTCNVAAEWVYITPETGVHLSISVSSDVLWITKPDEIVHRIGSNPATSVRGSFPNEDSIIQVATDNEGMVAALDSNGTLYLRDGVTKSNRVGTHWVPVDRKHRFTRIAVDSMEIFALDHDGKMWRASIELDDNYVGCFVDGSNPRGLLGADLGVNNDLTVETCVETCASKNYIYAGVQWRCICFCGNVYHSGYAKVAEYECTLSCTGNFNERCGGNMRNSVYKVVVDVSPSQSVAVNEGVKLYCKTNAPLDVFVAWSLDGVVLQNRTKDTDLVVPTSANGTFIYQCSLHSGQFLQTKDVTIAVEDPVVACANVKSLDDSSRSTANCDVTQSTDKSMESLYPDQWYQFYGLGGTQIPTTCVKENRCGGLMSGWLNGEHPEVADDVVSRQLCFSFKGDCCYHSINIKVRQCFGSYIYKFPKFNGFFQGRVCTEKEPLGTGPASKVSNPVFYMASQTTNNMALFGHVLVTLNASHSTTCNLFCWLKPSCKSFNYNRASKTCELNTKTASNDMKNLSPKAGFTYFHPGGNTVRVVPQK